MSNPILSVIIPAYNAEKYIKECIQSITSQNSSSESVRIIVVIDGSTDKSRSIAESLLSKHEIRSKLIVQENLGPATARNTGISFVETEYVAFLDADDKWVPDYLDTVLPLLHQNYDMIEHDALKITKDGTPINTLKIASAPTGKIQETEKHQFLETFRCYSWARIYRTQMVREHPFPSGRRFEDNATTPWYYWMSRGTLSVGKSLIEYRQHPLSTLATHRPEDLLEINQAIIEASQMYAKHGGEYWQRVTHRIFQFSCQRITGIPFSLWLYSLKSSQSSINGVPPPHGIMRILNLRLPLAYLILLKIRYSTGDFISNLTPTRFIGRIFPEI